jgi:predicted DNA-binding transcriptional regulator AlpA
MQQQFSTPQRLVLTIGETADMLGISRRTLWSLSAPRGPIPTVRIGRRVFYRVQDLVNFINQCTIHKGCQNPHRELSLLDGHKRDTHTTNDSCLW